MSSSSWWLLLAIAGLCFGLGAVLIRHIFEDAEERKERSATERYGILSAPTLALALIGAGSVGAWIAPESSSNPLGCAATVLAGALAMIAVGLPMLNLILERRQP